MWNTPIFVHKSSKYMWNFLLSSCIVTLYMFNQLILIIPPHLKNIPTSAIELMSCSIMCFSISFTRCKGGRRPVTRELAGQEAPTTRHGQSGTAASTTTAIAWWRGVGDATHWGCLTECQCVMDWATGGASKLGRCMGFQAGQEQRIKDERIRNLA
jgi:hypothetical protein